MIRGVGNTLYIARHQTMTAEIKVHNPIILTLNQRSKVMKRVVKDLRSPKLEKLAGVLMILIYNIHLELEIKLIKTMSIIGTIKKPKSLIP